MIHTYIDHTEDINAVRFHPDGTCIAACSDDKKIKLWDIRSKRLIQHYDAHSAPVSSISFHPSGNYLLSTGHDGLVKIWDLKLGQILYTLHGHEGPVVTGNFSNCGDFFATGGVDSTVMVWQSNITSMTDEFNSLKKNDVSHLKSNKRIVNESYNKLNESQEKFKISQNATSNKKITKYTVQPNTNQPDNRNKNSEAKENLNSSNQDDANLSQSQSGFSKLPPELASTFNKMIQQMDHIVK